MTAMNNKYSVGEFERRFLLSELPSSSVDPRKIIDHYVDGTRLRLRTVERSDRDEIEHKLGHKRRVDIADPTAVMCTSLYLNEDELAILSELPSHRLVKTRWRLDLGGIDGAVDIFEESLKGLIMLEVDLGSQTELGRFVPPDWVGPEVSHIEAFTGGALAGKSRADLAGPSLQGLRARNG
jgi:CYTH domain-containing protein